MIDEHEDWPAGGAGDAPGPPPGAGAGAAEHAGIRAALDEIEAAIDEAAATIARMA